MRILLVALLLIAAGCKKGDNANEKARSNNGSSASLPTATISIVRDGTPLNRSRVGAG